MVQAEIPHRPCRRANILTHLRAHKHETGHWMGGCGNLAIVTHDPAIARGGILAKRPIAEHEANH